MNATSLSVLPDSAASIDPDTFRRVMRELAGGVSVVTVGDGQDLDRTGMTVTSVASLSAEPPALVFCINQTASSWPVLLRRRAFGVNILSGDQLAVAERFSGRGGEKGLARFDGAEWGELATGTPVLKNALAVLDCEVTDIVEHYGSAVVIGRVVAADARAARDETQALTYWRGTFTFVRP